MRQIFIVLLLAMAGGCASFYPHLKVYAPDLPGSVTEDWQPHYDAVEWWYATGYLEDDLDESLFLYQFTIFHLARGPADGYILNLAITDYENQHHLFEGRAVSASRKTFGDENQIVFQDNRFTLDAGKMTIEGAGRDFSFQLVLESTKPAVWHDLDGVITMGHPDKPKERSFYYSFTNMDTSGTMEFVDVDGVGRSLAVTGKSWFDRQWGAFTETGWDWFSFRFFDGEEAMLFSFPSTGHKGATWIYKDGKVDYFSDFEYSVAEWRKYRTRIYGLGWTLHIPKVDQTFRVEPLFFEDFNPNRIVNYWEGLCNVYDEQGVLVGYCIVETTAPVYRHLGQKELP